MHAARHFGEYHYLGAELVEEVQVRAHGLDLIFG
jgi:hypothetical protein